MEELGKKSLWQHGVVVFVLVQSHLRFASACLSLNTPFNPVLRPLHSCCPLCLISLHPTTPCWANRVEIFNAYMHCYGCETILHRDLTLCLGCHAAGRFAFPPDPPDARLLSDRIHCPGEP